LSGLRIVLLPGRPNPWGEALKGLWVFYFVQAEYKTAREVAEQCLRLAQNIHNPIFLVWAHSILRQTLYDLGKFALTREHLEAGIALYDPQKRPYGTLDDSGAY
jgi:hypothetical protein